MKRIYDKKFYDIIKELNKMEDCSYISKEDIINAKVKLYEITTNFQIVINNIALRKILI